jgi:DNA-binding transcriptional LysR family regulator
VLDGRCSIGVIGSLPTIPDTLTYERLPGIAFLMVAARDHALTSYRGKIPKEVLGKHTRSSFSPTDRSYPRDANSASCRLQPGGLLNLFAKRHFLLKGLGWGGMPLHAVRKDLEERRLSALPIEDVPPHGLVLPMSAVWQTKSPPGPAGRWFVDRLKQMPVEMGKVPKPPVTRKKARRSAKT